ncbi:hypothetical protein CHO01_28220 [Cellulomonas hominis]|uniref:Uncharacterized protein n=1 Tax=Cellulomonas hominis TaxID=156981 RepID=A0A511FEN0_9CELL|nr:hypothetical protein [Cellulomonas hominis]MBB5473298.1 hypothetical protein [Cellulomonas hominis]NKY05571.1 hypothetical protein [Cellulomonas hominis]GEL47706.1 hypothetical protein CHO01_28220 [Cellulomonas hominis]
MAGEATHIVPCGAQTARSAAVSTLRLMVAHEPTATQSTLAVARADLVAGEHQGVAAEHRVTCVRLDADVPARRFQAAVADHPDLHGPG